MMNVRSDSCVVQLLKYNNNNNNVLFAADRCAGRLLLRHREHRRLQQLQDLPSRSQAHRERLLPILQGV